ncbi:uncharacterized protein LOC142827307 [Pelodiscus sinensis]|uniref:uncharacterized protein LOC142827307 n=1 Tax=Pelodiscus sinensis TaxID=13735 RepID=UPI003F6C1140
MNCLLLALSSCLGLWCQYPGAQGRLDLQFFPPPAERTPWWNETTGTHVNHSNINSTLWCKSVDKYPSIPLRPFLQIIASTADGTALPIIDPCGHLGPNRGGNPSRIGDYYNTRLHTRCTPWVPWVGPVTLQLIWRNGNGSFADPSNSIWWEGIWKHTNMVARTTTCDWFNRLRAQLQRWDPTTSSIFLSTNLSSQQRVILWSQWWDSSVQVIEPCVKGILNLYVNCGGQNRRFRGWLLQLRGGWVPGRIVPRAPPSPLICAQIPSLQAEAVTVAQLVLYRIQFDMSLINVSTVWPNCSRLVEAWLKLALNPPYRAKRDLGGWVLGGLGTGAGILNAVDIEVVANKLSATGSLFQKAQKTAASISEDLAAGQSLVASMGVLPLHLLTNTLSALVKSFVNHSWAEQCLTVQQVLFVSWFQQRTLLDQGLVPGVVQQHFTEIDWKYAHRISYVPKGPWTGVLSLLAVPQKSPHFTLCTLVPMPQALGPSLWIPRSVHSHHHPQLGFLNLGKECVSPSFGRWICPAKAPAKDDCYSPWDAETMCVLQRLQEPVVVLTPSPLFMCVVRANLSTAVVWTPSSNASWCAPSNYTCCVSNVIGVVVDGIFSPALLPPPVENLAIQAVIWSYRPPPSINFAVWAELQKDAQHSLKKAKAVAQQIKNKEIHIIQQSKRLVEIGDEAVQITQHHWWDIFKGWSGSARSILRVLVHPIVGLLLLLIVFFIVFLCLCCYTRRLVNRVVRLQQVTFALQRHHLMG